MSDLIRQILGWMLQLAHKTPLWMTQNRNKVPNQNSQSTWVLLVLYLAREILVGLQHLLPPLVVLLCVTSRDFTTLPPALLWVPETQNEKTILGVGKSKFSNEVLSCFLGLYLYPQLLPILRHRLGVIMRIRQMADTQLSLRKNEVETAVFMLQWSIPEKWSYLFIF